MSGANRRKHLLHDCYEAVADRFVETRKKNRPEFAFLAEQVREFCSSFVAPHMVEVGCGGGRLYTKLASLLPADATYVGVDFSQNMIAHAKKTAPQATWCVADMTAYLSQQPQESIDCLLGVASVHHIKGAHQRKLFFCEAYRTLSWRGKMILINWSFSSWFLATYRRQLLTSLFAYLYDPVHVWNDVTIHRKDHRQTKKSFPRYYHLFTLGELEELATQAGFVVRDKGYIAQNGTRTLDRTQSRNSFLVVEKAVN